jgi:hypothetical protein
MQVPNIILIVAAEIYVVLLIGAIILFLYTRKLKSLLSRQQEKLLELLRQQQNKKSSQQIAPKPPQSYKNYLKDMLDTTAAHYLLTSPGGDIRSEQAEDSPLIQRVLALRHAFLRSEELGTTHPLGSTEYWNIFQEELEPFLISEKTDDQELRNELETYKKRVENLEKFSRLFFDMEKKWAEAQANAQNYYTQLIAMSDEITDKQSFNEILQQYHCVYNDIIQSIEDSTGDSGAIDTKVMEDPINQDPRATEEIVKLRNVAAEQHRTINKLEKKLVEATTAIEKEAVFGELQQQLKLQTRYVEESETCIKLLENELSRAHKELSLQAKVLDVQSVINAENQHLKKQYAELEEKYLDLKLGNQQSS